MLTCELLRVQLKPFGHILIGTCRDSLKQSYLESHPQTIPGGTQQGPSREEWELRVKDPSTGVHREEEGHLLTLSKEPRLFYKHITPHLSPYTVEPKALGSLNPTRKKVQHRKHNTPARRKTTTTRSSPNIQLSPEKGFQRCPRRPRETHTTISGAQCSYVKGRHGGRGRPRPSQSHGFPGLSHSWPLFFNVCFFRKFFDDVTFSTPDPLQSLISQTLAVSWPGQETHTDHCIQNCPKRLLSNLPALTRLVGRVHAGSGPAGS